MTVDVLIVDDSEGFARAARDLVASRTGLSVAWASRFQDALDVFTENDVAVVVLDQSMPNQIPGTEVYEHLRRLKPTFKAIMLTAEATSGEVAFALKDLEYGDFLLKSRVEELPERVYAQFVRALSERSPIVHEGARVIWKSSLFNWPGRWVTLRLVSVATLNQRFVAEDSWITVLQLQAGEQRKLTYQSNRSYSLLLDEESVQKVQGTLKLSAKFLGAATSSIAEMTRKSSITRQLSVGSSVGVEQSLSLPILENTQDPQLVRSRHFQQAPVVRKLLLSLQLEHRCCGARENFRILAREDSGIIATRHQDYLNDHSVLTVDTGDLR